MLSLLTPRQIEIVKPAPRLKAKADTGEFEGLELLVCGYTFLDSPGCLLAGDLQVELFTFRPASGNDKGDLLAHWSISLEDEEQQRRFWNPILQMYEFTLGLDIERVPPSRKYVLQVTYNSPLGEHLIDETVFDTLGRP